MVKASSLPLFVFLCCFAYALGQGAGGGGGDAVGFGLNVINMLAGGGVGAGIAIVTLIICTMCLLCGICLNFMDARLATAPLASTHIEQARSRYGSMDTSTPLLASSAGNLSGVWRGWYKQYESEHNMCDFDLQFSLSSDPQLERIVGQGVDDIGQYRIEGIYDAVRASSIAFRKSYMRGSRNDRGIINHHENRGHDVEYRGERVGPNLGQGFRGSWYINLPGGYKGHGTFQLWPGKIRNTDGGQHQSSDLESGQGGAVFKVSEDNVCVVCFDRAVDVCLEPCGHVAICSSCADRLPSPKKCPICRSSIVFLAGPDGGRL